MPSKTRKQHNLMAMSSTPEGRKKLGKKAVPEDVADEYLQADKGKHFPKGSGSGKGKASRRTKGK